MEGWIECLRREIAEDSLYEFINANKGLMRGIFLYQSSKCS